MWLMPVSCDKITKSINKDVDNYTEAISADISNAIESVIGYREDAMMAYNKPGKENELAKYYYDKMYNALYDNMMQYKLMLADSYNIEDRIIQIKDHLQDLFGTASIISSEINAVPARRMISASKSMLKLIELQKSRFGKKLPWIERAILPLTMFSMRVDPFGKVYAYTKKLKNILEDSRTKSSKFKSKWNNTTSLMRKGISSVLTNYDGLLDASWAMDGLEIRDRKGNKVTFLGETDEGYTVKYGKGRTKAVSKNIISREMIKSAIIDKYSSELVNDIMHGQTRFIKFVNEPPTGRDAEYISDLLDTMSIKNKLGNDKLYKGQKGIHETTLRDGSTVTYIIVRSDKSNPMAGEYHNAYIIRHRDESGKSWNYFQKMGDIYVSKGDKHPSFMRYGYKPLKFGEGLLSDFMDGYHKASEWRHYGEAIKRSEISGQKVKTISPGSVEQGWSFDVINRLRMKNQPNALIVDPNAPLIKGSTTETKAIPFWSAIDNYRSVLSLIESDIRKNAMKEHDKIQQFMSDFISTDGAIIGALKNIKSDDKEGVLKNLNNIFNISNQIWFTRDGELVTPNSTFRPKSFDDPYMTTIYDDDTIDEMLDIAIAEMEESLMDKVGDEHKDAVRAIKQFKYTRALRTNNDVLIEEARKDLEEDVQDGTSLIIAQRLVYSKHRALWVDPNKRRRDTLVFEDYLTSLYSNMQKNSIMASALDLIKTLSKTGDLKKETIDWLLERTKLAFHDPTAAAGIGKIDYSYQAIANVMNKISPTRKWTAEGAEKFVTASKSLISMALLGSSTAITNRTQIFNLIISNGFAIEKEARDILNDKYKTRDMWEAIIDNAGTDSLVNMLMDVLTQGTEAKMSDMGLLGIPGVPVQIPTKAFMRWVKLSMSNLESASKISIPEIDKRLIDVELARIEKSEKEESGLIEAIRNASSGVERAKFESMLRSFKAEEEALDTRKDIRNIEVLRKNFLELILSGSDVDERIVAARYKKIMGRVTDKRLRKMVSWKLSYWPKGFGEEVFSMTESERIMRKETVIISLLVADRAGMLGDDNSSKPYSFNSSDGRDITIDVSNRYMSPEAVRIARTAVEGTMFSMTANAMGDAFNGLGAQVFLYKSYALQQMMHDWRIAKAFFSGSENMLDSINRLKDEAIRGWNRINNKESFNPDDSSADSDAARMLRLMGLRVGMSFFVVVSEMLSIVRIFWNNPMLNQINSTIRGGQNPAVAIAARMLWQVAIMSSLDDDDWFEGNASQVSWDIARLFLPVFVTLPAQLIYKALR